MNVLASSIYPGFCSPHEFKFSIQSNLSATNSSLNVDLRCCLNTFIPLLQIFSIVWYHAENSVESTVHFKKLHWTTSGLFLVKRWTSCSCSSSCQSSPADCQHPQDHVVFVLLLKYDFWVLLTTVWRLYKHMWYFPCHESQKQKRYLCFPEICLTFHRKQELKGAD